MDRKFHCLSLYIPLIGILLMAFGCASTPKKDYTKFRQLDPHSILIVPVLNNSPEVGADTFFLATVSLPLAERGYYVFPVNMTRELLIEAGLDDAGMMHEADPQRIGELFGADAILYIIINHLEAKYLLIRTTVTVGFSYILKDTKTGKEIWKNEQVMEYTPDSGGSLLVAVINSAVTKAMPNYIPLSREANSKAFIIPHQGLPAGPYNSKYGKDSGNY